jgi:hypothetical protein
MGLRPRVPVSGVVVVLVAVVSRVTLAMTMADRDVARRCMLTVVGLHMGELITLPLATIGRRELLAALTCVVARAAVVDRRIMATHTSRRITTGLAGT